MRKVLGIVAGVTAAFLLIALLETIGTTISPLPAGLESMESADSAALAAAMAEIPLPAKLLVVAGWLVGAFGGAWLALRISDWRWSGWIVAALVIAALVIATRLANIALPPHPFWMQACALAMPLAGGWLAARLHRKPYPGEPLLG
jgi:hypothetical protein